MARIERLINLVAALLETTRPMPADEIRDRIDGYEQTSHESFRRAFERDKAELRDLGVPLETVPLDPFDENAIGYRIDKSNYYLPELDLAPDELAALRMAADALLTSGDDALSAFMKVAFDSPVDSWSGPRVVVGADIAAEDPLLGPLHGALLDRNRIRFEYRSASGESSRRIVEPHRLVYRRGNWYLVGRDIDRDESRTFRVSRIAPGLTVTDEVYDAPARIGGDELAGEPWEIGADDAGSATIRFSPGIRWWAEQNLKAQDATEAPDGALDVRTPLGNIDALVSWAIGFGDQIEIIGPEAARRRMIEKVGALAGSDG